MKKFLITGLMALLMVTAVGIQESYALFGIKINFERGTKEWNADHSDTKCVGGGFCTLTIDFNYLKIEGEDGGLNEGVLANYKDNLVIQVSRESSEIYREDYENGTVRIDESFSIPAEVMSKIGLKGDITIEAGNYDVIFDDSSNTYIILLN